MTLRGLKLKGYREEKKQLEKMGQSKSSLLKNIAIFMSVKSPLGLVLFCYFNMPTINTTYLILSYLILLSMPYAYYSFILKSKSRKKNSKNF